MTEPLVSDLQHQYCANKIIIIIKKSCFPVPHLLFGPRKIDDILEVGCAFAAVQMGLAGCFVFFKT